MKLSLSRWRKDTISREGSSFFQSDPLPQSLSRRRGKNYLIILNNAKNLFSPQFLKIDPLPLSLSRRRGKNYLVTLSNAKNLFPQQFKKIQPSPSIPLPSERGKLPRHTELSEKSLLSAILKKSTLSLYPSPIGDGRITTTYRTNFLSNGNSLHNYFR